MQWLLQRREQRTPSIFPSLGNSPALSYSPLTSPKRALFPADLAYLPSYKASTTDCVSFSCVLLLSPSQALESTFGLYSLQNATSFIFQMPPSVPTDLTHQSQASVPSSTIYASVYTRHRWKVLGLSPSQPYPCDSHISLPLAQNQGSEGPSYKCLKGFPSLWGVRCEMRLSLPDPSSFIHSRRSSDLEVCISTRPCNSSPADLHPVTDM